MQKNHEKLSVSRYSRLRSHCAPVKSYYPCVHVRAQIASDINRRQVGTLHTCTVMNCLTCHCMTPNCMNCMTPFTPRCQMCRRPRRVDL